MSLKLLRSFYLKACQSFPPLRGTGGLQVPPPIWTHVDPFWETRGTDSEWRGSLRGWPAKIRAEAGLGRWEGWGKKWRDWEAGEPLSPESPSAFFTDSSLPSCYASHHSICRRLWSAHSGYPPWTWKSVLQVPREFCTAGQGSLRSFTGEKKNPWIDWFPHSFSKYFEHPTWPALHWE